MHLGQLIKVWFRLTRIFKAIVWRLMEAKFINTVFLQKQANLSEMYTDGQNINSCLICCWPIACFQNSTDLWRPGLYETPEGCPVVSGTKMLAADPPSLLGCEVEPPMDQACWCSTSGRRTVGLRSWDSGDQSKSMNSSTCIILHKQSTIPLGNTIVMKGCNLPAAMFR